MKLFIKISTIISVLVTLGSFITYFFVFDRIEEEILQIIRGLGFIGISMLLLTYQYDFRHNILSENKKKMGQIIMIICSILAIVFIVLAIFQFCK